MGLATDSASVAWLAGGGPLGNVPSLMRHEQYLGLGASRPRPTETPRRTLDAAQRNTHARLQANATALNIMLVLAGRRWVVSLPLPIVVLLLPPSLGPFFPRLTP